MPDYTALLRKHFSGAKLPPDVEEELASHLAEAYEAELTAGANEDQAFETIRTSLGDPAHLLGAVRQYKGGSMRAFLRRILIPGLFATVLTTLAGSSLNTLRINHNFDPASFFTRSYVWFFGPTTQWGRPGFVSFDVPLLLSYLLAGAVAAYLSVRLGGERRQRLCAALVPAAAPILLLAAAFVGIVLALLRGHGIPPLPLFLWGFSGYLIGWTVLPALALLLGATPFIVRAETPHNTGA